MFLVTTDPHLTSDGRCPVHYDSIAALGVLLQMFSDVLDQNVCGICQDAYVVTLSLVQSQVVYVYKVVL